MDMKALLARYAASKTNPLPPRPVVVETKPKHPLYDRLVDVKNNPKSTAFPPPECEDCNLGILFIIIDKFPNELLWRLWLEQEGIDDAPTIDASIDTSIQQLPPSERRPRVRCWFHAKFPDRVASPWVRARLVKSFHFRPEWGSLELTKVMVHMLHEATTVAPQINKFCFASESCVPIAPLQATLQRLYSPPVPTSSAGGDQDQPDYHSSWVAYRDTANNGYATRDQFGPLERCLPPGCVYKASQWVMLSRTHAIAVLGLLQRFDHTVSKPTDAAVPPLGEELFAVFSKVRASDEMFFPCCLAVLGLINPPSETVTAGVKVPDDSTATTLAAVAATGSSSGTFDCVVSSSIIVRRQLTYADWRGQAANPIEYSSFPVQLVREITGGGGQVGSAVGSKRARQEEEGGGGPAVDETQKGAVFLRKIKFPSGSRATGTSPATSADVTDAPQSKGKGVFSAEQEVFLTAWLRFVAVGPAEGGSGEIERALTRAAELWTEIARY